MKEQKQRIVSDIIGDCFPACMATILGLPLEVLPNDHSNAWFDVWQTFLRQFGLTLQCGAADGAIWATTPWIATVSSKNYKDGLHAIIMHEGGRVLFDPSTKKVYKKGQLLVGKGIVKSGYSLVVRDADLLYRLKEYRDKLIKE
jgi:hypothetical protein